ncbi:CDC42 small effector protein 2 [Tetranychus urticae]|nr:CDC42 small effector protein 2 [Tetranychus urticae]
MSDMLVQCFTCCVTQQTRSKRRRRIDRSMIGSPTNFKHTAHVGFGEMSSHIDDLQNQLASKGGYEYAIPVSVK